MAAKTRQILGGVAVVAFVAARAVFTSGVPATWRLRLIVRSKPVRRACDEAEEQLRARLAAIARTYALQPVLSRTIDSCWRASR
ncbi:hypothetical protein, partial [Kitasatospora sp. NPDC056531]|uniref:hypothetical protein n=1 Tax=Kitasatospora sp. NPDC056531 TaxID=3345856 RepID=UPI0036C9E240